MRYQTYLSLFTIINFVFCFSDQLYDKFIHYAKYTALSSCITHGNLSEGWFNKGACTLKFCYDGYNAGAKVIKVIIITNTLIFANVKLKISILNVFFF